MVPPKWDMSFFTSSIERNQLTKVGQTDAALKYGASFRHVCIVAILGFWCSDNNPEKKSDDVFENDNTIRMLF